MEPAFEKSLANAPKAVLWGTRIFLCAAGVFLFLFLAGLVDYAASVDWPTAGGRVTKSGVTRVDDRLWPDIAYEYVVEGRPFTGDDVFVGQPFGILVRSAQATQRLYPEGARVTVYYDPDHPARSALEPGLTPDQLLLLAGTVVVFFLLLGMERSAARASAREHALPGPAQGVPGRLPAGPLHEPEGAGKGLVWLIVLGAFLVAGVAFFPAARELAAKQRVLEKMDPSPGDLNIGRPQPKTPPAKSAQEKPGLSDREVLRRAYKIRVEAEKLVARGDMDRAVDFMKHRVDLLEKYPGVGNRELPRAYADLGGVLVIAKRRDEAAVAFHQALGAAEKAGLLGGEAARESVLELCGIHMRKGENYAIRRLVDRAKQVRAATEKQNPKEAEIFARAFADHLKAAGYENPARNFLLKQNPLAPELPRLEIPEPGAYPRQVMVDLSAGFKPVTKGNLYITAYNPWKERLFQKPVEGIDKAPAFEGRKRWYGILRLGVGPDPNFLFILDEFDQGSPAMWVDKNQNRDLTDDGPPYRNQGTGYFAAHIGLPGERVLPGFDFGGKDYFLWFFVHRKFLDQGKASFYTRTVLKGTVNVKGWTYTAWVGEIRDNDADYTNDGLYLDLNHNGKVERKEEYIGPGETVDLPQGKAYFKVVW